MLTGWALPLSIFVLFAIDGFDTSVGHLAFDAGAGFAIWAVVAIAMALRAQRRMREGS